MIHTLLKIVIITFHILSCEYIRLEILRYGKYETLMNSKIFRHLDFEYIQ